MKGPGAAGGQISPLKDRPTDYQAADDDKRIADGVRGSDPRNGRPPFQATDYVASSPATKFEQLMKPVRQ